MNWNPYKRIAELEAMHAKNIAVLDTLADKLNDLRHKHDTLGKWMVTLESRLQEMDPSAAAPVRSEGEPVHTKAKVNIAAEYKRMKKREYQRKWYAKQRVKEKQRQYAAAYRARKKAAAAAALAVGGTE